MQTTMQLKYQEINSQQIIVWLIININNKLYMKDYFNIKKLHKLITLTKTLNILIILLRHNNL